MVADRGRAVQEEERRQRIAGGEAAAAGAAGRPGSSGGGWQWRGARPPNAKFGEDWRSEKRIAAGEAAAAGAAGRPSCCGWRMAAAGRSGSERTLKLGGWRNEKLGKRRQRGLREGRAAVDGGRHCRALGKRPNAKLGGWHNERSLVS